MPPSVAHPVFAPQAFRWLPHARGCANVATRPGCASASLSSPPCSVATADARLRPRPEPGRVRLASSRTNRSTACLRSAFRNAGAAVGDAEQHGIALAPGLDQDLPAVSAPSGCADGAGLPYLIAFSTRLASAWLINSRLPCSGAGAAFTVQRHAVVLGQRLVELVDAVGDLGRVEIVHVAARLPGLGARDHQQRIEGADQAVGFLDRALQRRAVIGLAARAAPTPPRRGCAAASAASSGRGRCCRRPPSARVISASMRSSMALRFSARRSSSSPLRPTGSRPERSPAMMRWVVPVMASIRCSTRRATKMPPPMPSTMTTSDRPSRGLATMPNSRRALLEVAPDQQPEAAGQFGDAHQRAVIGGVLLVEPAIGGLRPAGGRHHAGRQRADVAGDRLPGRRGDEIKAGARPQRAVADGASEPAQAPPIVDAR